MGGLRTVDKTKSNKVREKRPKISNRLKRQRSPSPEKDESKVPAPRNPRRLAKAVAKKAKLLEEKAAAKEEAAKKKLADAEESEEDELNKESLSKLKGAFDDDDFEGFERMDDSDAGSADEEIEADEFEDKEAAGSGDEQVEESDEVSLKYVNNGRKWPLIEFPCSETMLPLQKKAQMKSWRLSEKRSVWMRRRLLMKTKRKRSS
jgi:hypothetical protein